MKKMEFKLILFFTLVLSLNTLLTPINSGTIPVRVGLVVDMDSYVGQMGFKCIEMALSDFYAAHGHYKTRLLLSVRDSKEDIVGAAAAALDLLKNDEVQAIIGPLTSGQANFVINLGHKAHVPVITFSATSPSSSIRSPYFIRAALSDSSQVQAISAIIQAFGWRRVVPIYVDNEYGEGIIPFLTDSLEKVNALIPYRSVIPPSATDDQIDAELYKLMMMETRVFVVHMQAHLGGRLFAQAKQKGMMSEEYAWIVTDGIANELSSLDSSVVESMLGVIGVKPRIARTEKLDKFTIRYKKTVWQKNPSLYLSIYGLWAYDSAVALAFAAERARARDATFVKTINISSNGTDLDRIGVSSRGPELIQALSSTTFGGLAGKFELINGQLQTPPYQIENVVGPGARVVGFWTKEMGIVRHLNFTNANKNTYTTSKSNIGSIIWPGDRASPPKGWVIPISGKKLRIGVPVKHGFFQFLKVIWNSDNTIGCAGYSVDVFDAAIKALPYSVKYECIPFSTPDHKCAGNYNDLVYQVYQGKFDGAIGDIAIVANRTQYVDFTLPYTQSGVSMVVPVRDDNSKKAWDFLKPLPKELWFTSFFSFVLMGFLIWILEHRINEDFRGPPWDQVGVTFWFAFSTMVFAQKEKVISNMSRFVLIIWFLVVLILTQSYTASLTSMLTLQQMQPTVTDVNELIRKHENVGYQEGSFVYGLLRGMHFDESKLKPFKSTREMDDLFTKGTANGGIAAAFDDIPCLKIFLAKYCSKYTMVGPTYKTDGFGFIFPIGSPLVTDISRAILEVTESKIMMEIEKKWLGNKSRCSSPDASVSSNSLAPESFRGLFMIVGIVALSVFVIYVFMFLRQNWHVVNRNESTTLGKLLELTRRFYNRDPTYHAFNNIERRENRNCCRCDCMNREVETTPTNAAVPPSPILPSPEQQNQNGVEQDISLENDNTNVEGEESQCDDQKSTSTISRLRSRKARTLE